MLDSIPNITLVIVLAPLVGAIGAGLFGKKIGCAGAHWLTIILMAVSFALSILLYKLVIIDNQIYNGEVYTWGISGGVHFSIGFLIDRLSTLMILTVTFVSFLVHIYSIGYMRGDPGDQRFFSYISLFTFSMLMLVSGNNFLQLFFGWEGVGLVSYLLIGFWFTRESAIQGSLKAFIVNRVGDFGFILGIAAILNYFGSIDYATVFQAAPALADQHLTMQVLPGTPWQVITMICLLLFIGAMGKSAQIPLHVWLPESMEGPTPISALIHAATMVTAGIYMVSRMSPLFELSQMSLSVVMIVGATGALALGLVGIVQNDIKRVIAYSTLSQLGYMMAALGASAYAAGMFHLFTHACFKALLFLAAGSVIIALHHEQDMRAMGGLRKYMPITYFTFLIGALALSAIPPFSGYYSKDAIIEAMQLSTIPGSGYAFVCLLLGAFVTPLYIFRAFFLTFHGEERMDAETKSHIHESPTSICLPLIVLAVPSVVLGALAVKSILYTDPGLLGESILVLPQYNVLGEMAEHFHNAWLSALDAVFAPSFWLSLAGIFVAWFTCIKQPQLREQFCLRFPWVYKILVNKYGFDAFNEKVFVQGTKGLGNWLYEYCDDKIIDGAFVNGSGRLITWISNAVRYLQSGYLYHYAFAMLIGLVMLLFWLVL